MSINSIKNKLKQTSIKDTTWIEKAKFRKENKDLLDISFAIAAKKQAPNTNKIRLSLDNNTVTNNK